MGNEIDRFGTLWDGFCASLSERLEKERQKQMLSYSVCTLLLNDEKLCWNAADDPCGKWLEELQNTEPVKADLILSIIMDDVKFSEPEKENPLTLTDVLGAGVIPLVLSLTAMALCLGVFHTSFVVTLLIELCVEIAALLVFFLSPLGKAKPKSAVNDYVAQLDKYKGVITGILSREPGEF